VLGVLSLASLVLVSQQKTNSNCTTIGDKALKSPGHQSGLQGADDPGGVKMPICTRCGAESLGTFSPCECGFTPGSNTEMADISGAIKSGEVITVDPVALAEIAGTLDEEFDNDSWESCLLTFLERRPSKGHV
jgi:hypothetical protein